MGKTYNDQHDIEDQELSEAPYHEPLQVFVLNNDSTQQTEATDGISKDVAGSQKTMRYKQVSPMQVLHEVVSHQIHTNIESSNNIKENDNMIEDRYEADSM